MAEMPTGRNEKELLAAVYEDGTVFKFTVFGFF